MSNEPKHWLTPHKCPVCRKSFYPAAMHVYKDHRNTDRLVCTYSCSRESERLLQAEIEARPQKKRGPKSKAKNKEET